MMRKMIGEYEYEISWLEIPKMQTNKQTQQQKEKKLNLILEWNLADECTENSMRQ